MKTYQKVYIAIDLHTNSSTIGYMDQEGKYIAQHQVQTSVMNLVNHIVAIPAEYKVLTIEQGNMTFSMAEQLQDYVHELIVCDPRHNALIHRGENKSDKLDTMHLCTLLRLDSLKQVWRPKKMGTRRVFFDQVKTYQRRVKTLSKYKRQFTDSLRHWGINRKVTRTDYKHPQRLIECMENSLFKDELLEKLRFIEQLEAAKETAKQRFIKTGKEFWEIPEFMKIPGIGPVGAHRFSGYIQTPYRFRRASQLIKFCSLSIRKFTSDGHKVRSERLSKAGHGCLKGLTHTAWTTAMGSDNEVSRYYQDCLEQGGDEVGARLSTERKILVSMWALWKNEEPYDAKKFTYKYGDSTR
jgi:transposase